MLGQYLGHGLDKNLSSHSRKATRSAGNKANLARFGRPPHAVGSYTPWLIARCIAGAARKQGDSEIAAMAAVAFGFCHRGGDSGDRGPIHGEKTVKEQGHALRVHDVRVTDSGSVGHFTEMRGDVLCPVARYEAYTARVAQRTAAAVARGKPRPDRMQHFHQQGGPPAVVRSISAARAKYAKKTGRDTEGTRCRH
jgi:hypothetical protein